MFTVQNLKAVDRQSPGSTRIALSERTALTLVELLVVIVLITTLVTTAIPVLAPGGDSRKIREASRAVNSFFAGAQARAIETGRPYGVAIKRLSADTGNPEDNGVGVELSYVETPPVYAGLSTTSRCRLTEFASGNFRQLHLQFLNQGVNPDDGLPAGWDFDPVPGQFLRPGDTIWIGGLLPFVIEDGNGGLTASTRRIEGAFEDLSTGSSVFFDAVGFGVPSQTNRFYVIPVADLARTITGDNNFRLLPEGERFSVVLSPRYDSTGAELPPPEAITEDQGNGTFWTAPAPYKIFRQPVPAQGQPLQLPAGAAIDLAASGFTNGVPLHRPSDAYNGATNPNAGNDGQAFSDDVVVMFSPEGTVSTARFRNADSRLPDQTKVTSSLALLVGRRELIPAEPDEDHPQGRNINDPVDLSVYADSLEDDETKEKLANYNWLDLDSRWVVIGAQTGSVTTVENSAIGRGDIPDGNPFGLTQQMAVVRANAPSRLVAGGR